MALTFDTITDRGTTLFGSENQATIVSFVNERHGRMVSESEWAMRVASITTTVNGTDTYNAPSDLVDLRSLRITTTGAKIERVPLEDIWAFQSGDETLVSPDQVFAQTFSSTGALQLVLYPVPTTTGDTIYGFEALHPSDGTYGGADSLVLPKHIRPYLLDGVLADGYEQLDERPDLAQLHESRYEVGIDKLRRLKNSRMSSGPSGIRLLPTAP